MSDHSRWIDETLKTLASYRRMIDAAVVQLSDGAFFAQPQDDINSVAIILRHLGGTLQSRWTDFLESDGEKPTRDRETEFEDWHGSRQSLMEYFQGGWDRFYSTLESLQPEDLEKSVLIRGEMQTVPYAILRGLTHVSYHVGQILLVSRMVHKGDWNWLTIAPGASERFNQANWGTPASRGIAGGTSLE